MSKLVIDKVSLGWAKKHRSDLLKRGYTKIEEVGKDLQEDISDYDLALYCKTDDCNLVTMDKRAFAACFKAGIKRVEIELLGWDETTKEKRPVLLIRYNH